MVKRVNERYNAIQKTKELLKINKECKTEEDIIRYIGIGNKEQELVAIKLFIDKILHNKNFTITIENYSLCKKEASKLFN